MATLNSLHVRDNSSLTNFKDWAQAISNAFSSFGWTQSADAGQVNWSTIATAPPVNTFVYEIWQPGDALTPFFVKVEYGTGAASSNTQPVLRLSIGTGTNGSGTLTGFVTNLPVIPQAGQVSVSSTTTKFQCYFSGDVSRFGALLWRDDTANQGPVFFCIQRSINSSGSYTSDFVTLVAIGGPGSGGNGQVSFQQTIVLGQGAGIAYGSLAAAQATSNAGLVAAVDPGAKQGLAFGGLPVALVHPATGKDDNPMDSVGVGYINDFTEGMTFTVSAANMPYGEAHTYLASNNQPFRRIANGNVDSSTLLMRYD